MAEAVEQAAAARRIRRPIHLIGSGRSGTSLLGNTLQRHPAVAYWGEPRPVWMHGNAYRRDHVLRESDLTPSIARYIDERFADFLAESGRERFAEKTPSNCLRIGFIHALYPDCKLVHILRDGLEVVRSAVEIRERKPNPGLLRTRLRETPIRDWPAYLPMAIRTVWRTNVLRRPARYWGAQPPGWRDWLDLPPHRIAAKQWKAMVEISLREGRRLPASNYLEVRFEEVLADPEGTLLRILDFLELAPDPVFLEFARGFIDPTIPRRNRPGLSPEQRREAIADMQPLLGELGYGQEGP